MKKIFLLLSCARLYGAAMPPSAGPEMEIENDKIKELLELADEKLSNPLNALRVEQLVRQYPILADTVWEKGRILHCLLGKALEAKSFSLALMLINMDAGIDNLLPEHIDCLSKEALLKKSIEKLHNTHFLMSASLLRDPRIWRSQKLQTLFLQNIRTWGIEPEQEKVLLTALGNSENRTWVHSLYEMESWRSQCRDAITNQLKRQEKAQHVWTAGVTPGFVAHLCNFNEISLAPLVIAYAKPTFEEAAILANEEEDQKQSQKNKLSCILC